MSDPDTPHAPGCARHAHPMAECTCGKAAAEVADAELAAAVDRIINLYRTAPASKIEAGDVTREGVAILREVIG